MSTIKNLYDLFEKLHSSIKDRQILKLLFPIKEKILEAEKENLQLQEKILTIQREHDNTVSNLQKTISTLHSEINELQKKIASYENKQLLQSGIRIDRAHR